MPTVPTLMDFDFVPLSERNARVMIAVYLEDEQTSMNVEFTEEHASKLGFIAQVFYKRLAMHKVRITHGLALLLLLQMTSPAHAVLWCWTLFNIDPDKMITVQDWAESFSSGIPSPAAYEKAWDSQKVTKSGSGNDNLLDDPATWVNQQHVLNLPHDQ